MHIHVCMSIYYIYIYYISRSISTSTYLSIYLSIYLYIYIYIYTGLARIGERSRAPQHLTEIILDAPLSRILDIKVARLISSLNCSIK